MGYKNEEFDRLTDEARVSIDPGLREQLYRKAEGLVREDCVLVPLYHERFHAAASPGAPRAAAAPEPTPGALRGDLVGLVEATEAAEPPDFIAKTVETRFL